MPEPKPDFERDISAFWVVLNEVAGTICLAATVAIAILLTLWLVISPAHAGCQTDCWTDSLGRTHCNTWCWGTDK